MNKSQPNPRSMYFAPTDTKEINTILHGMKPPKSAGPDNLTPYFLKQLHHEISEPISILVNMSITNATVPNCLKLFKVIPIHKAKAKDNLANYRPISLLTTVSKVLEKIVYKRLYSFLDTCNIFSRNQYGFRKNHSTIDAVTKFIKETGNHLDNKESVLTVYCDLSRAFDTLDHKILLKKLNFYGIRGHVLDWFRSYLKNRRQFVKYNGHSSKIMDIDYGIPQGSIMGPLLYIIYMNDLPENLESDTILFADDTTIFGHNTNIDILFNEMTAELVTLIDWFQANKLSLNTTKTHFMLISNTQDNRNDKRKLRIGTDEIARTPHVKFLGIMIDERLKWDKHIELQAKKINSGLYAINKAKLVLNTKHLTTLYYALIYPHLLYGITLWGNTYNLYLNRLVVLQKRVIRIITNSPFRAHTEHLFEQLKLLKLPDIYKLEVAKTVMKFHTNTLPKSLCDAFKKLPNTYHNTRQSNTYKVIQPRTRTTVTTRSIINMGPRIWNDINSELYLSVDRTRILTISTFSHKYKAQLLRKYQT